MGSATKRRRWRAWRTLRWQVIRELARQEPAGRKGVGPVLSLAGMARPDLFGPDEDVEAFMAHVCASRWADLA